MSKEQELSYLDIRVYALLIEVTGQIIGLLHDTGLIAKYLRHKPIRGIQFQIINIIELFPIIKFKRAIYQLKEWLLNAIHLTEVV